MYTRSVKRILIGLICCLVLFCCCFTAQVALATGESDAESPTSQEPASDPIATIVSEAEIPDDSAVSDLPSDEPASDDPVESDQPDSEPSTASVDSSQDEVSSAPVESTSSESSQEPTSSLQVEAVSEGGAPDDDTIWFSAPSDASYVYDGSYVGLAPGSEDNGEQPDGDTRRTTAKRFASYATAGMIVFGVLSLVMLIALIYFNRKVRFSKKTHPEWYPDKKRPKH